jgi:anthranilate phosphoribosyltransferase
MFDNMRMTISHFIREIGRGKEGARHLTRAQAHELMALVLDGQVSDLELGAFCVAMRIKGETPEEMAGFLDATHERLCLIPNPGQPAVVVLPSYNGSRRLPLLTPLLALLLAREGLSVLVHGGNTEDQRVATSDVMQALGLNILNEVRALAPAEVAFAPTALLCPGLWRLLEVRRSVGLRNPGHSLVKLMNPVGGLSLRVASYTHPEYAVSMQDTLSLLQANAMLLRGTEGEPVADYRRAPQMLCWLNGQALASTEALDPKPEQTPLPTGLDAHATAALIQDMLHDRLPIPLPVLAQARQLSTMAQRLNQA